MTIKKDLEIYSVNPLHLIFNKVSGYFESKEKIKKYGELWSIYLYLWSRELWSFLWRTIRSLIRSVTKSSDDYDKNI